jgi:hypothetical protein
MERKGSSREEWRCIIKKAQIPRKPYSHGTDELFSSGPLTYLI